MAKLKDKNQIIVILGPTSSGKTRLAVELANKFNGEIVSADSRQVYRGMDIGTGKDLAEYTVPYHLIDVASPKKQFDLARYQKLAFRAIEDILSRGKLPILAGGSGLYLQAVVDNYRLAGVKKNLTLRKKLEKLNVDELFKRLAGRSLKMAAGLNQSDRNNKRRLVRYLEILEQDKNFKSQAGKKKYQTLIIGLICSPAELKRRIVKRLMTRLKEHNLIGEVEGLHQQGLSWKKLESFGLEYKYISLYLEDKLDYKTMVEQLLLASQQFARRQMSWFRRWQRQGAKINWLKDNEKIKELVKRFVE
jgi:tRNA dimethylallyltransferase